MIAKHHSNGKVTMIPTHEPEESDFVSVIVTTHTTGRWFWKRSYRTYHLCPQIKPGQLLSLQANQDLVWVGPATTQEIPSSLGKGMRIGLVGA